MAGPRGLQRGLQLQLCLVLASLYTGSLQPTGTTTNTSSVALPGQQQALAASASPVVASEPEQAAASPAAARAAKRRARLQRRRPWVIAHRGLSGLLPEHTLPAYSAAIAAGADFVE
jgi:hypothetical protein